MGYYPSDIRGLRSGRLVAVCPTTRKAGHSIMWECLCDCGQRTIVRSDHVRGGRTKSCGCLQREMADSIGQRSLKHGHARRKRHRSEYERWTAARQRCFNPNNPRYRDYGGRGITMCERWRNDFQAFFDDMGACPPGLTLERKDNDGHYEPTNCIWASVAEQNRNKRKHIVIIIDLSANDTHEYTITDTELREYRQTGKLPHHRGPALGARGSHQRNSAA